MPTLTGYLDDDFSALLERTLLENTHVSPDYQLAKYLQGCWDVYKRALRARGVSGVECPKEVFDALMDLTIASV